MTWTQHHNRGELLRTVIATVDSRRDGVLPLDVEGVRETFGNELHLLGALMLKWHTRLNGAIERQLLSQPMDLSSAVVAAWCSVAEELPGVRAVIDHYREHPVDDAMAAALHRATLKEHAYLATMAGLSSVHDLSGAPLGADLEERARALHAVVPVLTVVEEQRPSFLERIKAALVA